MSDIGFSFSKVCTHVIRFDVAWLQQFIKLGTKFTRVIFPDGTILVWKPVFLLGQPIRLVSTSLGDEVDLEACFFEDIEWMKGLSDE